MIYEELAALSAEELMKRKRDLQATMFEARMKNALGQLPNPMTIRHARRDVARINTVMRVQATGAPKTVVEASAHHAAPKKVAAKAGAKAKTAPKKSAAKKAKA